MFHQTGYTREDLERAKREDATKFRRAGDRYYRKENMKSAVEQYDASLNLFPSQFEVLFHRGMALEKLGRNIEALQDFSKVAALAPNYYPVYNIMGLTLSKIGKMQEALDAYNLSLQFHPNNYTGLLGRASVL